MSFEPGPWQRVTIARPLQQIHARIASVLRSLDEYERDYLAAGPSVREQMNTMCTAARLIQIRAQTILVEAELRADLEGYVGPRELPED